MKADRKTFGWVQVGLDMVTSSSQLQIHTVSRACRIVPSQILKDLNRAK
jgi:hypothetical protein